MKIHKLKTVQPYMDDVLNGIKQFEVRKDDRDFQVGDRLDLIEWNGQQFTEKHCHRWITYKLTGEQYGIKEGYCVLELTNIEPDEKNS